MTSESERPVVSSLDELKEYVYSELCSENDLLSGAFPTSTTPLYMRSGELCGMIFCVHGPRSVDFTAIWEKQRNRVLFYAPTGERCRQTVISGDISLHEAGAANSNAN